MTWTQRSVKTINVHKQKKKAVVADKSMAAALSSRESITLDNDDSSTDSASDTATNKPFSLVGFEEKSVGEIVLDSSSSSDGEDSSAAGDSVSSDHGGEGKGG